MVIKHIPVPFSILSKMLNKELAELRSRYQTERDNTILERIRQDIDSLESFIQQFTASQSRTFDFQMHLMITADTKEELENKKLNLKTYLDSMEMTAIPLKFEQERVLKSILPIFEKQPIEEIVESFDVSTVYKIINRYNNNFKLKLPITITRDEFEV
jgi:hypothetical protein